jgi:hypothetical protein
VVRTRPRAGGRRGCGAVGAAWRKLGPPLLKGEVRSYGD